MSFINMYRTLTYFLIIFVTVVTACTPEYKLAKEFRETPRELYFHVTPPATVYKYNHKGELVEDLNQLNQAEQDSALYYSSGFIQYINDSVFLENYVNGFLDELRSLKLDVFIGHEADSFLLSKAQSYEITIAQVQLDEYFYPYEDQEYYYDTLFYKKFDLDAVDFSIWLELSKLGGSGNSKAILYSTHMASDNLEGEFVIDPFRQDVKYSYTVDSLKVEDIPDIASFLGKVHASYLYDFFLNQYVAFHLPKGYQPQFYYHYNRFRNSFIPVEEERFELLDSY
ncbi:MAG: hypothetical protein IH596_03750 [Bacteroidales bacterium]|nr:hypothetical protein [Bacteroidales bacterium]